MPQSAISRRFELVAPEEHPADSFEKDVLRGLTATQARAGYGFENRWP